MPKESILTIIADNQLLFEAVKEIIIKKFNDDEISTMMDDNAIGQVTRAKVSGMRKVEDAFREIATYKTEGDFPKVQNPAR